MTTLVHPTAVVADAATLGTDVHVGPYAVIGEHVTVADGTTIGAHAVLEGQIRVGRDCRLGIGVVLGTEPQDLTYDGEPTRVEIGDRTVLREYATVHRATVASTVPRVGEDCYLMAYVHIAHDCDVGNRVTLANAVQLAGHVTIEDGATVGGSTPIHQFVRIGRLAFVGGGSRVSQDIPPFGRAAGNPIKLFGVNTVALRRLEFTEERIAALQRAHRILFNSRLPRDRALGQVRAEFAGVPDVEHLVDFVTASERGVLS